MKTNCAKNFAAAAALLFPLIAGYAQYEGVVFSGSVAGYDFTGMNLNGSSFSGAPDLTGAAFTDADVHGVSFGGTVAKGFTEAMLQSTKSYKDGALYVGFSSDNIAGWNFSNLDLQNSVFTYSGSNRMLGTNLADSDIRGAYLSSMHWTGVTAEMFYSTASYKNKDLTGVIVYGTEFVSQNGSAAWSFAGQNLTNADFSAGVFADASGTVKADFTDAIITGANFGSASTWTSGVCSLTADIIYSTASYKNKNLQGVILNNNDIRNWNLSGQDLTGSSFYLSNVDGADFTGAIIRDADFYWGMPNASYANQNDPNYGGLTKEQLYSTKSYQDGDLRGINLGGMWFSEYDESIRNTRRNLDGWNFSNMNLEGASFYNARVRDADFTGANITGVDFSASFDNVKNVGMVRDTDDTLTFAQLQSTASYANGNLQGVNFSGISVEAWNFAGKDLTNAGFESSDMTGTVLTDAVIIGADFRNATKYGLTAGQIYSTASYKAGDLSNANFGSNDLSGWLFTNQNLTNVNFAYSTLADADFTGATILGVCLLNTSFKAAQLYSTKSYADKDLRGVTLDGTALKSSITDGNPLNFVGQNLQNANLRGDYADVDFTNADMRASETRFMTGADNAVYKNTIWSDGAVKNAVLAAAADKLIVKNYNPHIGTNYVVDNTTVITTKLSDADLVMTGGELVIETGAPLALVQHKSLTADGGMIRMNYGTDGFGVINVYGSDLGKSEFIITENTEYYIDFGAFGPSADEYLMVDASFGGTIVGSVDYINFTVMDNGSDVSGEWEFKIVGERLYISLTTVVPEPSAYALLFGIIAFAAAKFRRKK